MTDVGSALSSGLGGLGNFFGGSGGLGGLSGMGGGGGGGGSDFGSLNDLFSNLDPNTFNQDPQATQPAAMGASPTQPDPQSQGGGTLSGDSAGKPLALPGAQPAATAGSIQRTDNSGKPVGSVVQSPSPWNYDPNVSPNTSINLKTGKPEPTAYEWYKDPTANYPNAMPWRGDQPGDQPPQSTSSQGGGYPGNQGPELVGQGNEITARPDLAQRVPLSQTPMPPVRPGDASAGANDAMGKPPMDGGAADKPAPDATAAGPAYAPQQGPPGQGGQGQFDPGNLFREIMPLIMMMMMGGMGRGGMGAMLPMMMGMMGGGQGGFPGMFRGGWLGRGYYPNGRGGMMFHPGGYHPGWGPGRGGPFSGGRVAGANALGGRGRMDPAAISPLHSQLSSLGFSPAAQSGVIAGLMGESGMGLDPTSFNTRDPGGGSGGIGQWNRGRLIGPSGMLAYAQNHGVNVDPMNPRDAIKVPRDIQVGYLMSELKSPQFAGLRASLQNARSPQEALWAWITQYERPANPQSAYAQRSQYLNPIAANLNRPTPAATTSPTANPDLQGKTETAMAQ